MTAERITVTAAGRPFEGFESVKVKAALNEAARSFSLEVSEVPDQISDTSPDNFFAQWHFPPGTEIEIRFNDDLAFKGEVDEYAPEADKESHRVGLSGRGTGKHFVDTSVMHPTGQFVNRTIQQIADALDVCKVGVKVDPQFAKLLTPVSMFRTKLGASPHEEMLRLCQQRKLVMTGQSDGSILITRAGSSRHAGALAYGINLIRQSARLCNRERFSDVMVVGQTPEGWDDAKALLAIKGVAKDKTVKTYRPKVIKAPGKTDGRLARQRAEWEVSRAAGRSLTASVTSHDVRDAKGLLWQPGFLIFLQSPIIRIEQDMVIESVEFSQDNNGGTLAHLDLVDPRAYAGDAPAASGSDPVWRWEN